MLIIFFARITTIKKLLDVLGRAWRNYQSYKLVMEGEAKITQKRKLKHVCFLLILTYSAQIWSLTKLQRFALGSCHREIERSILFVKLSFWIRNSSARLHLLVYLMSALTLKRSIFFRIHNQMAKNGAYLDSCLSVCLYVCMS